MPPKKSAKATNKKREEDEESLQEVDVKYNPEIVTNCLNDIKAATDVKCEMILRETNFLITSMEQAFHLEMIKLPANVKKMSMKQFREEFNFSLDAVTRSVMIGAGASSHNKPPLLPSGVSSKSSYSQNVFETPSTKNRGNHTNILQTPGTAMRNPREGEVLLSVNGSPLGEFCTVKKAPKADKGLIVPPTPGVFVPLKSGEIVDLDTVDIENLPEETKLDALQQMETMMQNMRAMMEKLQGGSTI